MTILACDKKQKQIGTKFPEPKVETLDDTLPRPSIDYQGNLLRMTLGDSANKFELFCTKDGDHFTVDSVLIAALHAGKSAQKINLGWNETYLSLDEIGFSIYDDANFDGHNDLTINNYAGNYTSSSSFWLFDEKSGEFVHEPSLDSIYNPGFEPSTKRILSSWHAGLSTFSDDIYIWKGNKVVLLESITENRDFPQADGTHYSVKRLVNGKYIEKDSIAKKPD